MSEFSVDALRQVLSYDSDTGVLTWKWRPREMFSSERSWKIWNTRYANQEAFTAVIEERPGKFYRRGRFAGKTHYLHRVAWAIHTGEWPEGIIDHDDGDGLNNRFVNLRDTDKSGNAKNSKMPTNNTSGVVGVYYHRQTGRWNAKIKVDRLNIHIGLYNTIEAAAAARKAAEVEHGFHPNHGRVEA